MKDKKADLKIRKIPYQEVIGWVFLGIALVMLGNSIRLCFSSDIWYDELFTVGMFEHSYGELVHFTAKDVHPPLYYCITKFVVDLWKLIIPSADSIVIAKTVSVMPYFLLLLYSLTLLRKRFGMLTAGVFFFCILSMPQLSAYTVEMRMYSFAMFLVTAAFIHACEIVYNEGHKWGMAVHYAALTCYGLAAAYTQYFACVAVVMIYVFLFLWHFGNYWNRKKSQEKQPISVKPLCICVAVSIFAYLPWLFVLFSQIAAVRANYWIQPLSWRSLGGCVKFLMKPVFENEKINVISAAVLFFSYVALLFGYGYRIWRRNGKTERIQEEKIDFYCALAGCMTLCGLVAFGFLASILIRPIFVYRYMLPAIGCFWLGFILSLRYIMNEARLFSYCMGGLLLIFLLFIGIRDYRVFMWEEEYKITRMEETELAISAIAPQDIILYNFDQLQAVAGYYMPQESYLWNGEPEPLIGEMFKPRGSVQSTEQIKDWLAAGRNVWFFGSFNSREDICAGWEEDGLNTEEMGSYMLERYWFNIYSICE